MMGIPYLETDAADIAVWRSAFPAVVHGITGNVRGLGTVARKVAVMVIKFHLKIVMTATGRTGTGAVDLA